MYIMLHQRGRRALRAACSHAPPRAPAARGAPASEVRAGQAQARAVAAGRCGALLTAEFRGSGAQCCTVSPFCRQLLLQLAAVAWRLTLARDGSNPVSWSLVWRGERNHRCWQTGSTDSMKSGKLVCTMPSFLRFLVTLFGFCGLAHAVVGADLIDDPPTTPPAPPDGWPTSLPTGGGPGWLALIKDQSVNLRKCAASAKTVAEVMAKKPSISTPVGIRFLADSAWPATTTGVEVCAKYDAGDCVGVQDWTCSVALRPCSDTAEGSRMVLCLHGGPPSLLGWSLVLTLAAFSSVYVVGGVAYGMKVRGAPAGLKAHPHEERWAQLAGLVSDGISFAKASARGDGELNSPLTTGSAPVDNSSMNSCGNDEEVVE